MTRLRVGAAIVDGRLVPGDVDVSDGVVTAVGLPGQGDRLAVPGFVDLQVNGFGGVDFLAADGSGFRRAGTALLETGVTAYQPTLITAGEEAVRAALGEIRAAQEASPPVAPHILGAHVEGPFLSPERLGTHPPEWRRGPDRRLMERLLAAGPVTFVTLAPELPGALALIDLLVGHGVVVSCGHSDATAAQAHVAFDRGARAVTHLFNAMRPLRARDPGITGAALCRDDVVLQLVVDGHHLAPETVGLAMRAGPGRVALVTDGIAAAGIGDGAYRLGDVDVRVEGGAVRREDGTLAGSALTMIQAVRNLHALGFPLADCVAAATSVPARLLGRGDCGALRVGGPADVVVLDDRLEVRQVVVGRAAASPSRLGAHGVA